MPVKVETGNVPGACHVDMYRCVTVYPEQSAVGRADIDVALSVFADIYHGSPHLLVVEIALDFLIVVAPQAAPFGSHPYALAAVLYHVVDGLQHTEFMTYLVCRILVSHAQQAMSGGADQHVTVLSL